MDRQTVINKKKTTVNYYVHIEETLLKLVAEKQKVCLDLSVNETNKQRARQMLIKTCLGAMRKLIGYFSFSRQFKGL